LRLIEYILVIIIVIISLLYFIDHDITHLHITSLPGEVGLVEHVCTHLFVIVILAADLNYVPEEFE
jgi:hypothetical protein